MIRHLKSGGMIMLLFDLHAHRGTWLTFLGLRAKTATSAAEIAQKTGALLVPSYATREGMSFRIEIERPLSGDDPAALTQALNDQLGARIHADPGQWFWVHRRWKGVVN